MCKQLSMRTLLFTKDPQLLPLVLSMLLSRLTTPRIFLPLTLNSHTKVDVLLVLQYISFHTKLYVYSHHLRALLLVESFIWTCPEETLELMEACYPSLEHTMAVLGKLAFIEVFLFNNLDLMCF